MENGNLLWRELYFADDNKSLGGGRNVKCDPGWRQCIHMCQGAAGLNDLIYRGASEKDIGDFIKGSRCVFLKAKVAKAQSKTKEFGIGRDNLEDRIETYEAQCLMMVEELKTAAGGKRKKLEGSIRSLRGGITSSRRMLEKLDERLQS